MNLLTQWKMGIGLLASLSLSSLAVSQTTEKISPTMTIKPVQSVLINTRSFEPPINESVKQPKEAPNEKSVTVPAGPANNLRAGSPFFQNRVSEASISKFPAISFTDGEPPDPELAVSNTHIVVTVNSAVAFYDKRGTRLFQQNFDDFFRSVNPQGNLFDPKIFFDHSTGRFFMVVLGLIDTTSTKVSNLYFAVSQTGDPRGQWRLTKYDSRQTVGGTNFWFDYPGWGFGRDHVAVSGNMFAFEGESGSTYATVINFNKAQLINGTAAADVFTQNDAFTIQLAKAGGTLDTTIYGAENVTRSQVRLYALTNGAGGPQLLRTTVNVAQWPAFGSRMGTVGRNDLDPSDTRMLTALLRNGSIYATHPRGVSNSDSRVGCRWYEFRTNGWPANGTPSVAQTGDILPPTSEFYSYPAVNVNQFGDMGICFARTGSSVVADVMASGRLPGDPAGRVSAPVRLESSLSDRYRSVFDPNSSLIRWGDYYDVEVDPADNRTFWMIGMGAGTNGLWQTFVRSFRISTPSNEFPTFNPLTAVPLPGTLVSGDRTSLFNLDNVNYAVRSDITRGVGQIAGVSTTFNIPIPRATLQTLRVQSRVTAPAGASVFVLVKNQSTGSFEQVDTYSGTGAAVTRVSSIPAGSISRYVSATGGLEIVLRVVQPTKSGQTPASFTAGIDALRVQASESL